MSVLAIVQWERSEREPSWSNVLAIAQVLGVSCEAFTQVPATSSEPRPRGRPRKATEPETDQGGQPAPAAEEHPKKTRKRKQG